MSDRAFKTRAAHRRVVYDVGVVGCGTVGERVATAVHEHPEMAVGAVCDLDRDRARSFGERFDAAVETDHEALVARELDVVYVGVPPAAHERVATDALDAGHHVLCEKPLAPEAAAASRLADRAAASDRVVAVNLPFRYTPGFRALVTRVADGAVGPVRRARLHFRFPRWPREWQDVDWLRDRDQGGPVREVGTHFVFGLRELFDTVRVADTTVTWAGPGECESSVLGRLVADEVPVGFDLLTGTAGPEENSLTVEGEAGRLSLVEWYRLVADRHTDAERTVVDERADTTTLLLDELVAALDGDGDGAGGDLVGFDEAAAVAETVETVLSGAETTAPAPER